MSIISDLILVGASLGVLAKAVLEKIRATTQQKRGKKFLKNMKKFDMKFNLARFVLVIFVGLIVGIIIFNTPKSLDAEELKQFNRDPKNYNVKLQILNQSNVQITEFMVAIADDDYKKMYGLMNLEALPKDFGMLFNFHKNIVATMWMKNTKIALDMLFIDDQGVIANIKHDAEPYSLEIISSEKPVNQVIEINGGLSKKLGIDVGDKIRILENK